MRSLTRDHGWERCALALPSRCAQMACSLPQRCAQLGVSRPVSPRAVRRVDQAVRLSLALCADGVLVRFSSPPRCAQVGVSVLSHRCAVRRVDQAWSADAPKKRSDAFANTLKVSGGHERGATCARSADAPTAFPRAVRGWGVGPFLCSLHRAVRRWECPSGLTAARCAGWIRRGVLIRCSKETLRRFRKHSEGVGRP